MVSKYRRLIQSVQSPACPCLLMVGMTAAVCNVCE